MATDAFQVLATRGAAAFGLPDIRMITLPHPVNTLGTEGLAALQERALLPIARALAEGS